MKRIGATSHHIAHCRGLPLTQRWCVRVAIVMTVAGGLADLYMRGHL